MLIRTFGRGLLVWLLFAAHLAPASPATPHSVQRLTERPLTQILTELGERYGVYFNYETQDVAGVRMPFELRTSEVLESALRRLLAPTALDYELSNKRFVIIHPVKAPPPPLSRRQRRELRRVEGLAAGEVRTPATLPNSARPTVTNTAFAPRTVSGTVVDERGEPLIGVTVLVKGTSNGTVTDVDGSFSLTADETDILQFSYLGYAPLEVAVNEQTELAVTLNPDASTLDEVVVTAFGIDKNERTLSYATQKVDGNQLTQVGNTEVVSGLQGKVAGVVIRSGTGAPGAAPQITIRGSNSLTGNNQPLYVIDGVPVANSPTTLNPDIIESIDVLKGGTAAALYGLRASNGVILITTKKGSRQQQETVVELSTNYRFERVTRLPDYQTTYAQGSMTNSGEAIFEPGNSPFSYGPRIDGIGTYTNEFGEEEVARFYPNAENFFRTGGNANVNLSVSKGNADGRYLIGVGYTDQYGVVERTGLERFNALINGDYDLGGKVTLSTSVNYSNTNIDQTVQGGGNSNVFYAAFNTPTTYDLANKPISRPENPYDQFNFRTSHDNIYWALRNNIDNSKTVRTIGNIGLNYAATDWMVINYRLGTDYFTRRDFEVLQLGSGSTGGRTEPPSGGQILERTVDQTQINSNFNVTFNPELFEGVTTTLLLGNELYDTRSRNLSAVGSGIQIGGFNNISNTATILTDESNGNSRVVGFFGSLDLSYQNMLSLSVTGRQDIVSNLPAANRSFFYPSVGVSAIFSDLLNLESETFTYGKLRASYAEVGQAPDQLYVQENVFIPGGISTVQGSLEFPFNQLTAFRSGNTLIAGDLRPINTRTWEVGTNLKFFSNRLDIDYTYFKSASSDQIFNVPVANSTGYTSELRNAGKLSSRGHEVTLAIKPVAPTTDFEWQIAANFTSYDNRVEELAEGIDRINLGGFNVEIVAEEGLDYPSIRGTVYARDDQGRIVVDDRETVNGNPNPRYGMPLQGTERAIIGKVQPDFELGLINTLRYRALSLTVQVDVRQGGMLYSGNNRLGKLYGTLPETAAREEPYVEPGVKGRYDAEGELVTGGENDIVITRGWEYFRRNGDPIDESNTYDASFVRLREVVLSYVLPTSLLERLPFTAASLQLLGRNLLLRTDFPNYDPEAQRQVGGNNAQGIEYVTYPQTKSFGAGLRLTF